MLLDLRLQIGPNGQNDTVHVLSDTLGGRAEASMHADMHVVCHPYILRSKCANRIQDF